MQHRRTDNVLAIRIHTSHNTPFEALDHLLHEIRVHGPVLVDQAKDTLVFAGGAADLLPALEEVFCAEFGAFHVLV